jgi:hypothetical protein
MGKMMKRLILLPAMLLGACQAAGDNGNQSGRAADASQAEASSRSDTAGGGEPFYWTGRFAASRALCSGGVWDIRAERIQTQGETSCEVQRIERSPDRVILQNACLAEGIESEERWTISRGGEGGITVERDMGPDIYTVDLIRCG